MGDSESPLSKVYDILPPPFDWIAIPPGKVTLVMPVPDKPAWDDGTNISYVPDGTSKTFDVPAFVMAKYPITRAQFAPFVEAGGYQQRQWWTDLGWEHKEQNKWQSPRYWKSRRLKDAFCPVIGVSWDEAVAFCLWLSDASGESIMLPTELQWQRAAQGDDNRLYPWGNDWDAGRCNNLYFKKGKRTTVVTQFEGKGDSPFGVVDMAGNVFEWCLTNYETGSNELASSQRVFRVIRSQDYIMWDSYWNCRIINRSYLEPDMWSSTTGFRIVHN